ncbi:MAG: hypothetical protein KIG73_03705 [Alphaproteobacteria bacterium]|nr:hypothetical protein [Alphaproteobacteria bacterium]
MTASAVRVGLDNVSEIFPSAPYNVTIRPANSVSSPSVYSYSATIDFGVLVCHRLFGTAQQMVSSHWPWPATLQPSL